MIRARAKFNTTRKRGEMTKLESRYWQYLQLRVKDELVVEASYEAIKFNLAGGWYTPDFMVIMPDGGVELHETKGFRETATILRCRLAAQRFPWFKFVIVEQVPNKLGGGWKWEEV